MSQITLDESERTRCEIYSRVVGYHRPTNHYNLGKQQEFKDRTDFTREAADLRMEEFETPEVKHSDSDVVDALAYPVWSEM